MLLCHGCRTLVIKRRYRSYWNGKLCDKTDKHEVRLGLEEGRHFHGGWRVYSRKPWYVSEVLPFDSLKSPVSCSILKTVTLVFDLEPGQSTLA
jgi:hypothetical protein